MKKTLIILLIIFICIFIASLVLISLNIKSRNDDIIAFEKLSRLAKVPLPTVTQSNSQKTQHTDTSSDAKVNDIFQDTQDNPINLAPLTELNEDCVGWITVSGTKIDYPVMHTPNEPNKYFRRNFYGQYSVSGVPYIFETCTQNSTNLIIFGHNMLNGTMFAGLMSYRDKEFFNTNRRINYKSQNEIVEYEIFCVAVIDDTDSWYTFTNAQNEAEFDQKIRDIKSRSLHTSDHFPIFGDRLITLSTCHKRTGAERIIVVAASVEKDK